MFYSILENLCKENNVKISPLLKELGLSVGAISRWKKGIFPSAETLMRLSKRFNCSIDYLLGLTDAPTPPSKEPTSELQLADDEQELLNIYRALNSRGKTLVKAEAYREIDKQEAEKQSGLPKISEIMQKSRANTATVAALSGGVYDIEADDNLPKISEIMGKSKKK
ncbi:MAG: helix-turn-helix domain-containing protein [Oscillospiraceae bacterium]|nr:helix-turn-helix domain-containing protein [Oscillospiraceae bacterium]